MDQAYPLSTPIVIRSLDVKKKPFYYCENNEKEYWVLKSHV